jgi:NADPH-dependent curcumin reductase CurA
MMMNLKSRMAVCGLISNYNDRTYGVKNFRAIPVNRIRVQGLIVFDWLEPFTGRKQGAAGPRRGEAS